MERSQLRHRITLGLGISACFLFSASPAQEEEIVGTWNCSFEVEQQESMSITTEYERVFDADGTSTIDGEMRISVPAMEIDFTFTLKGTSTWRTEPMTLFEQMEEIEVDTTSESPTEIEQMFVQQMQAQLAQEQEEERIEIISLTATAMELDADGPHICSRA